MKKKISVLLLGLLGAVGSCSKSDTDTAPENFISSQEYTPLRSFDDLTEGGHTYKGFKAASQKESIMAEDSKACRALDELFVFKDEEGNITRMEYNLYTAGQFGCYKHQTISLVENKFFEEGVLFTTIKDPSDKRMFKGLLEIGFQGGYLRIEDRMSSYLRKDPEEKVYLYFKK